MLYKQNCSLQSTNLMTYVRKLQKNVSHRVKASSGGNVSPLSLDRIDQTQVSDIRPCSQISFSFGIIWQVLRCVHDQRITL